jgi:signal transduction histidine kinase
LRARLIVSHALVLLLAMLLVLVISAGFLRRHERLAQIEQLGDLAVPLMAEVGFLAGRPGANLPVGQRLLTEALDRQAAATGVRLLVFASDGTVRYDSGPAGPGDPLTRQTLSEYAATIAEVERAARETGRASRRLIEPTPPDGGPLAGCRLVLVADGRPPPVVLGLAAPPQSRPLIRQFLPPLTLTLLVSLVIAAAVGYGLSRRIAAPVARLTAAAEAMARGQLEQRVAGEGPDELGRLVAGFNAMSHQVAATARAERELLANVAHELRTPLTSVRGYAQGLRDGVITDDADRTRALTTIAAEAERMGRLVTELLDLARLESGQARLQLEPVDLAPALERVVARFRLEAERRAVTLTATAAPDARVTADPERLTRLLGNLVDNALRHTPTGGAVALAAAPLPAGPNGQRVRLSVSDTGVGIPAERLDRIFERFERGDGAGTTSGGAGATGFGLGLAIVRELVTAHRGTIAVTSEVGVGTTFTVDLPAAD